MMSDNPQRNDSNGPIPLWSPPALDPAALTFPDGEIPQLTPYLLPDQAGPAPLVIVCPGGGYVMRAPHEAEPIARWLNRCGVAAAVLDYRVAPHRHPVPLHDAQRAIRLARHLADEWRIDPQRVGILGFSAGGHLAATTGTYFDSGNPAAGDPVERQSSRPDLMILCYPVITSGPKRNQGSFVNLLGDDAAPDLMASLSLEARVTASTPPTFLWHTADDDPVPVENSLLFASSLSASGVPFELHIFPHGEHGLGLAEDDPHVGAWTTLCQRWLVSQGFGNQ